MSGKVVPNRARIIAGRVCRAVQINMSRRYSNDPQVNRSLRHSVRDGVSYSIMSGAGETYFAAYALFLGATAAQVSLLAAAPPLLGALTQLLAAWLNARNGARRCLILAGAFMHALTWFPIIWLPFFFPEHAVPVFIACIACYHGWIGLGAPLWGSLMGDLVPARRRGRFFGWRNRLMSVTNFAALIGAGFVLHFFELRDNTRLGFMLVFSLAAAARLYSFYQLARMHEPAPQTYPTPFPPLTGLWQRLRKSNFAYFSAYIAIMGFGVGVAAPFFTVYMLQDLKFTYLQFTLATGTAVLVQFLTLGLWGRLADTFGNRVILAIAGSAIPLLPALWLVSSSFWYILLVEALSGVCWAAFGLAAFNYLYDIVPRERRASYWAIHNLFNSTGTFVGALIGATIVSHTPSVVRVLGHVVDWGTTLWAVFLVSFALRALVAVWFIPRIEEVRAVRPTTVRELVFRVVRFGPLAGTALDMMGFGRRQRRNAEAAAPPEPAPPSN